MIRSSLKKKKKTFWRILWCLIVNINAMQSDFCNAFYQQGRRMQPSLVVKTNYHCCKLTLRLIFAPTRLNRRKQQVITWPREWPLDQTWSRTKPGSCRTSSAGRWSKKPRRSQSDLRKRMTFYISFTCVHGEPQFAYWKLTLHFFDLPLPGNTGSSEVLKVPLKLDPFLSKTKYSQIRVEAGCGV